MIEILQMDAEYKAKKEGYAFCYVDLPVSL